MGWGCIDGYENINLASIRWAIEIIFVNEAVAIAIFISHKWLKWKVTSLWDIICGPVMHLTFNFIYFMTNFCIESKI